MIETRDQANSKIRHLGMKKGQTSINIFNLVHSELARIWPTKFLTRDDFQQLHQHPTIGEVCEDVDDLEKSKGDGIDEDQGYCTLPRNCIFARKN